VFRVFAKDSSTNLLKTKDDFEQYYLPSCNPDRTGYVGYHILTTKSAVTVEQGGTGANTAKGAQYNLFNSIAESTTSSLDSEKFIFSHSSPSASNGVFVSRTGNYVWNYIAEKIKTNIIVASKEPPASPAPGMIWLELSE
jgi:hypothetical protein